MKKRMFVCAALCAMFLLLYPIGASAASKKYVTLYRNLLAEGKRTTTTQYGSTYDIEFVSFRMLDINQDGTPELIIKNVEPEKAFTTVMIYSVKKEKLYFCGEYSTRTQSNILYSKKDKGIYDSWWTNGVGGSGSVTYTISLKKHEPVVKRWAWCGASSYGGTKMVYKTGPKMTATTKSKFNKYVKQYFGKGRFKTYKYYRNTASNRQKKIK